MPHQVSLSNVAYAQLKAQKQPGESFSDVVLRLLARPGGKDPRSLLRPGPNMDADFDYEALDQASLRRDVQALGERP